MGAQNCSCARFCGDADVIVEPSELPAAPGMPMDDDRCKMQLPVVASFSRSTSDGGSAAGHSFSGGLSPGDDSQGHSFSGELSPGDDSQGEILEPRESLGRWRRSRGLTMPELEQAFEVVIIRAEGLKNMDVVTDQDPFCRVSVAKPVGQQFVRGEVFGCTGVVQRGGKNPEWTREDGTVHVPQGDALIRDDQLSILLIEIFDKDNITKDDFVGECCLVLESIVQKCIACDSHLWRETVKVYRSGCQQGTLELEIGFQEAHLKAVNARLNQGRPSFLTEATPVTTYEAKLVGAIQDMQEGDRVSRKGFLTYEVNLQGVKDVFEDVLHFGADGGHPEVFRTSKGDCCRKAISTVKGMMSIRCIAWSGYPFIASGNDFLRLIDNGVRKDRRRVYTYCITDEGMCFSETGASLSKDKLSKHLIHADGAMAVRYAGCFRICLRDNQVPVLVVDNDSGTYKPKGEHKDRLEELFKLNMPGLEVLFLDATKDQPEWTKQFVGPLEVKAQTGKQVYAGKWVWRQS